MGCGGGERMEEDEAGTASSSSSPPIVQLGYDQVLSVLRLLPPEAVLSFAATCRVFRAWASSDALWEALCCRDWGSRATAALAERRRDRGGGLQAPWRRVYAEVARLGALSARRVPARGASPRPRASHSLNLVAGWLVLFGGGCEGGNYNQIVSPRPSCYVVIWFIKVKKIIVLCVDFSMNRFTRGNSIPMADYFSRLGGVISCLQFADYIQNLCCCCRCLVHALICLFCLCLFKKTTGLLFKRH